MARRKQEEGTVLNTTLIAVIVFAVTIFLGTIIFLIFSALGFLPAS